MKETNYAAYKKNGSENRNFAIFAFQTMEQMKLHMDGSIRELNIKIGLMASINFVEITSIM